MHDKSSLPAAARARWRRCARRAPRPAWGTRTSFCKAAWRSWRLRTRGASARTRSAPTRVRPISGGPLPYASLDGFVRKFWPEMAATGLPIVPNGLTDGIAALGSNGRRRLIRLPPSPTIMLFRNTGGNRRSCRRRCRVCEIAPRDMSSEAPPLSTPERVRRGGSVLCPTWSRSGADHTLLDAVAKVLKPADVRSLQPHR